MKMNFQDLALFCAVVKTGNFVGAAEELGLTPASVSKRVAALEQHLGVKLFYRTTRKVQITSEGVLAHSRAQDILQSYERLHADVHGDNVSPTGKIRISTSLRLGRNHISPILTELGKRYPRLDIWLELVDRRVDLLNEGFDIDIRAGDVSEPHLVSHLIATSSRILCASKDYLDRCGTPLQLEDLAQHECLLFRQRDQMLGVWRLEDRHGAHAVRINSRFGSNHADVIHQWVEGGQGIAMLSDWDVQDKIESGMLTRILPELSQKSDIWALTASKLGESPNLRLCVNFIKSQLQAGPFALP